MNAHTPGPWTLSEESAHSSLAGVATQYIVAPDNILIAKVMVYSPSADGRLIARTPELLDALRAFCGDYESTGFECAGLDTAYRHAKQLLDLIDAGVTKVEGPTA